MVLPVLTLVLASALVASAGVPRQSPRARIVVLGDSLASGRGIGADNAFPAVLEKKVKDEGLEFEIVNAGISGDTSSGALRRFERLLDDDVRVLVLELGANDGLRGVPVAQVKTNLGRMIEAAQARRIAVLLCGMEALPIHGWDYSVAFHNVYGELAKKYDVPLVPFILMNVIGNRDLMQPDHAHPNAAGARAIADNIWPYLKPLLAPATAAHR
ncbi:MAG: arylesterase [Acidobacteria bacterium]|jgi:acyl-CoA thioesterase-1|nr:arylesterase [Acidobacteriota bacterium]